MTIELKNISKKIKDKTILSEISIGFEKGNVYGLVGTNGAGKTMLMRAISGLIVPDSGCICIDGIEMKKGEFLNDAGIMIENPEFLLNYSGYRNLKLISLIKRKVTDSQIKDIMDYVGLPYNKKYRKYSLGMKKRLGIAAAIMESPQYLILDEPFNALDSEGVQIVKTIINEYKNNEKLVIISSHDITLIKELCDEIIYMEGGRIVDSAADSTCGQ